MSTVSEVNLSDVPKETQEGNSAWTPDIVKKLEIEIATRDDATKNHCLGNSQAN